MPTTKEQAQKYCDEYAAGQSKMGPLKSLWETLLFYYIPSAEHLVWDRGTEKGEYDVPSDDTGIKAANTMASGIYSYTVTRGNRIADLTMQESDLEDDEDVKEYLSAEITKATQMVQASNFASAIFETLRYYTVLGTDLLFSYYDKDIQKLNFRPYRVMDCWIEENASGKIHRVLRTELITHSTAEERWGFDKLPKEVQEALGNAEGVVEDSEYLHIIEPNPDYVPDLGASTTDANKKKAKKSEFFKYRQVWVHKDSKTVVEEGKGYRTFPYHVARSGVQIGQLPFGRSQAMDALPTVRGLHRAEMWMADATETSIAPPALLPKGSIDPEDWDLRPRAALVYNPVEGNTGPQLLNATGDINAMLSWIADKRGIVNDFFFVPLFNALDQISGSNPTATEVQEAAKQGIQGIAPVIGSLEPDVYTTVVERTLDLMDLNDLGTAKPEILQGKKPTINVTTQLDAELQNTDVRRTNVALGQAFEIMKQFTENPEMSTLIDRDRVIRNLFYVNNVDPKAVYSTTEAAEKQAKLLEAQKQQELTKGIMDKMGQIDPNKAPEPGSLAEGGAGV